MPAVAQTQVSAPTREEIRRERVLTPEPRTGARLSVEGAIERAPCPLADPRFADIRVTISDVHFNNLAEVSAEALRASWARHQGQSVPIATVCAIRDEAATILRRMGYLAAVQVPPQKIENGVVQFEVLMAKLVSIQVRGDAGRSERQIARYLDRIRERPVFNIHEAERYLLLARDLPGYDVRLTLRPAGTVPGEVIGEVAVLHTPVQIDANVQNYGSRDVGRFGGVARVQFNGLTGLGDQTTFSVFSTADFEEQRVVQAGHAFRIGSDGLTLAGDFTYAWTRPDIGGGLDLRSDTLVASLALSYPVIRSQAANLFASGGLDYVDQKVDFRTDPPTPISKDKLRVAFVQLSYDAIDPASVASTRGYSAAEPRWRTGVALELRQGLGIFGASDACAADFSNCAFPNTPISRIDADPTAFVARATGYAEFRPAPLIAISLSPRAQWAPDPLLSYEEFSAGNYTVGRGYDPGAIIGDSGIGAQVELRFGTIIPRTVKAIAIQPYVFFDAAKVWNEDVTLPVLGQSKLYSAGGGIRAAWGDHARLDAVFAAPLRRTGLQAEKPDPRVLISLTVKFLPWTR